MKLLKAEAGVNDGKAGLLSAAGLFAKGGIFDKKSESFNIQELDPYLLFDARSSMLGTLENPTLDLDPATPSTLDVITATRAGVATYTDPDGLIATASADTVRVDYTQGAELTPAVYQNIEYTDFSQDWTIENSTLTESQTTAPDGTTPVYELTENTSTSRHRLYRGFPNIMTLVVGQDYTVSAYVKKVSSGRFFLINSSPLNGIKGFLNLDTGVATLTSGTGTITVTDEGGGWYRLSVTAQATSTNGFVYMQLQDAQTDVNYTGTGASMLIYGPQLEEGTTASDFVANTTGSPKFITGATYGPRVPMILVEPSATNLVDYSEDIASNLWGKTGVSVTENAATAPDGTVIASKIQVDSSNSFHFVGKSIPLGAAYYSFSAYLKADTAITASFFFSQSGNNGAVFDLQAGSLISVSGTGNTASIEDVGNGWFRCVVTNNGSSDVADQVRIGVANGAISSFQGNETDSLYLWGVQVETGSVATSYIPTSGSTVTRAADDLEITGSAFTDAYNASEGTFYAESVTDSALGARYIFQASSSTGNPYSNRHTVYYSDHQNLQRVGVVATKDNASQFSAFPSSSQFTVGTLTNAAFSYKTGDFRFSADGGAELTPSGLKVPAPSINQIHLGASHDGSVNLNGHLKRLIYWPYHSDSL